MRRFFISILSVIIAVTSCEKVTDFIKNANGYGEHEGTWWPGFDKSADLAVFKTPSFAAEAKLITLDAPEAGIASVELTEGGRYVIQASDGTYSTGKYKVAGGGYTLDGFGSITLKGSSEVTISRDGAEVTAQVTVRKPSQQDALTTVMCRSWKLYKCWYYLVEPEFMGMTSNEFTGKCDFKQFSEVFWYGYGMGHLMFDDTRLLYVEEMNGTRIDDITLTALGTFAISFSGMPPYVGTWKWKDKNEGIFSYDFSCSKGGNIFIPEKGDFYMSPNLEYMVFGKETTFKTDQSVWWPKEEKEYTMQLVLKCTEN